jgi:hypothetical protein
METRLPAFGVCSNSLIRADVHRGQYAGFAIEPAKPFRSMSERITKHLNATARPSPVSSER